MIAGWGRVTRDVPGYDPGISEADMYTSILGKSATKVLQNMMKTAMGKEEGNAPDYRAVARFMYLVDIYEGVRQKPETGEALKQVVEGLNSIEDYRSLPPATGLAAGNAKSLETLRTLGIDVGGRQIGVLWTPPPRVRLRLGEPGPARKMRRVGGRVKPGRVHFPRRSRMSGFCPSSC